MAIGLDMVDVMGVKVIMAETITAEATITAEVETITVAAEVFTAEVETMAVAAEVFTAEVGIVDIVRVDREQNHF